MARRALTENVVKLTRQAVTDARVEPGQGERTVWDAEVRGLGLRVRASGSKTWVIRPPRSGGRSKLFTFGTADTLSLAQARQGALSRLAQAQLGDDPHEVRKAARAAARATLGTLIKDYLPVAKARLKPRSYENVERALERQLVKLHERPASELTRSEIYKELVAIGGYAGNRARSALSGLYAWAIGAGRVETNPVIGVNKVVEERSREHVISDADLFAIWQAAGDADAGRITKLLLLTGQRRNEVAGMRWSELDLKGAVWTIPGERTKNKRPHDVPLSKPALEVITAVPKTEGRDFVFGTGKKGFSGHGQAKRRLGARTKDVPAWRGHDLRRTLATRLADLGVAPHVVEAVLNHVSGSKAGIAGVYNRATYATEKRAALDLWASHVLALGKPRLEVVAPDPAALGGELQDLGTLTTGDKAP
ncbi:MULTISPECIES: site-specific integrase [Methylobacterium]|jgi:integrase|uniref:Prophage integrase IntA n=4 Tax=Pseudomonadota TaxID=1224 RepID=A0ABQ4SYR1_9HYPH|nr:MULTISPECIES: site-specific integrase [Methylobacterium]PIU05249.1 MAG: hypothetical protein COT56_15790 [Methylobacterium sp. CG09_land_8_20_14_0_10_71_15]PIU11992.1 MAG: hypothetical protein COT28_17125 [Methylobacterium sp. CG08_land_8_20_14_0_20_71_15]GBU16807.1 integrase [Methylobacterium sp.]GJE08355.1 Prophage integrase IntA [Methylobacterium jeotgali]